MKLYQSNTYQNAQNAYYPYPAEITDTNALIAAVAVDHVAAQYRDNKRSNQNFVVSDCLMMDVDNSPAKNDPNDIPPEQWIDLKRIAADLPDVEFYAVTSRNHMKEKEGRPARPKYHIYFPIAPITDATLYRGIKSRLKDMFPYFDANATDAARFFYGNSEAQAEYYPGSRTIADYIIGRMLAEPNKSIEETRQSPAVSTTPRSTSINATTTDNGLWDLVEIVAAIDPARLDYEEWVKVGMAMHRYPDKFSVDDWDAWSQTDPRYKPRDCYNRWNGFHDDKGGVGAQFLIDLAKSQGWTPPARQKKPRETPPPPEPPAYMMMKSERMDWNDVIEADEPSTMQPSTVELSSDSSMAESAREQAPAPNEIHAPRFTPASDYVTNGDYDADMDYFAEYQNRKTGFKEIDKCLTLYPGLAALGGASSLGKTTFCVNLADRLVKQGETVIYFALEQLKFEMITKSIARIVKETNPNTIITNQSIKNGARTPDVIAARKKYADEIGGRCYYINGDFHMTALQITEVVEKFMKEHDGVKPVIIVDYLQLIAPPNVGTRGYRGGIRENIDENLKTLKDMQKRNGLFVIVISSFNRSSNMEPLSYESFKETSMIEFTCDYVWGLQLSILDADNSEFYSVVGTKGGRRETTIDEKRSMINEAQRKPVKEVEFISLKNRNGKQFFKVFFDYYPQHDLYVELPFEMYQYPTQQEPPHIKL